jgi:hypothetical protein
MSPDARKIVFSIMSQTALLYVATQTPDDPSSPAMLSAALNCMVSELAALAVAAGLDPDALDSQHATT